MSKISLERYCKITNAFMVEGLDFLKYKHDVPECPCTATTPPDKLIAYCDIKKGISYNAFAHFYIDDYKFESIWTKPYKALEKLRQCAGVITPDFSTYQDDPEPIKLYNTYRMRAFGRWLTTLGFRVINNVRWGTKETWSYCFEGIPLNSIVSIGTVGCIKEKCNWRRFAEGLEEMIRRLTRKLFWCTAPRPINFSGNIARQEFKSANIRAERTLFLKRERTMSKGKGYAFSGTTGDIVHLIQNLPPKPTKEFLEDWNEFVSPKAIGHTKSREFWHKETKLRVRFDVGQDGMRGFRAKDHWHVYNPNRTSKLDAYLDENANPTYDGSNPSHILPKK